MFYAADQVMAGGRTAAHTGPPSDMVRTTSARRAVSRAASITSAGTASSISLARRNLPVVAFCHDRYRKRAPGLP